MNACEMCTITYHVVFLIRSNIEFALFIYEEKEVSDRGERGKGRKKEYYKGEEVKGERCALIFNARRMAKFHGVIKKVVGNLQSDKLHGAMEHCVLCPALRLRDLCEGGAADRRGYGKTAKGGLWWNKQTKTRFITHLSRVDESFRKLYVRFFSV